MSLKISFVHPLEAEQAAAWQELGVYDPTRLTVDHEWNLVQHFGKQRAQIAVIFQDEKPILRFLMHYVLPDEGTAGLEFFVIAPEARDAILQQDFQPAQQKMVDPSVRRLVGPMNGSSWFTYRLRGDEHPLQFDWELKHQPRLQALLDTSGFYS